MIWYSLKFYSFFSKKDSFISALVHVYWFLALRDIWEFFDMFEAVLLLTRTKIIKNPFFFLNWKSWNKVYISHGRFTLKKLIWKLN